MSRREKEITRVDLIYQDEMINFFRSIESPTWVAFHDASFIADKLLSTADDTAQFLALQQEVIYGNPDTHLLRLKNPVELTTFKSYLDRLGFKILQQLQTDEQGYNCLLIDSGRKQKSTEIEKIGSTGLPEHAEIFYKNEFFDRGDNVSQFPIPRVLNIGSGGDRDRQLPHAINVDYSPIGRPDVIADARHLPFRKGVFSVVMASHILEHIPVLEIDTVLQEWIRVLHPKGILRIAVPDAKITLKELIKGSTAKGSDSYSIPGGSAPLTQLIGLGGEHSKTDLRWRHQILFSYKLLAEYLSRNGLSENHAYGREEALSLLSGIKLDECNRYSMRIESHRKKLPHKVYDEIDFPSYLKKKEEFLATHDGLQRSYLSIIVPVRNEEKKLPLFLDNLYKGISELSDFNIDVEIIFSINDTTDGSEQVISNYFKNYPHINSQIINSQKGILNAFVAGISSRKLKGKVLKVDVDSIFESHSIPLLFMNLHINDNLEVTYAEVKPKQDTPNGLNATEYYQDFRNERLYFHGRLSLYRENPFNHFPVEEIVKSGVAVEDMILSCMYAYYLGIDSIGITPGVFVRSDHATSFDKLSLNWERSRREMKLIEKSFPHLNILRSILKREITPEEDIIGLDEDPLKSLYYIYSKHFHQALSTLAKINFPNELFETDDISIRNDWDSVR